MRLLHRRLSIFLGLHSSRNLSAEHVLLCPGCCRISRDNGLTNRNRLSVHIERMWDARTVDPYASRSIPDTTKSLATCHAASPIERPHHGAVFWVFSPRQGVCSPYGSPRSPAQGDRRRRPTTHTEQFGRPGKLSSRHIGQGTDRDIPYGACDRMLLPV